MNFSRLTLFVGGTCSLKSLHFHVKWIKVIHRHGICFRHQRKNMIPAQSALVCLLLYVLTFLVLRERAYICHAASMQAYCLGLIVGRMLAMFNPRQDGRRAWAWPRPQNWKTQTAQSLYVEFKVTQPRAFRCKAVFSLVKISQSKGYNLISTALESICFTLIEWQQRNLRPFKAFTIQVRELHLDDSSDQLSWISARVIQRNVFDQNSFGCENKPDDCL